MADVKFIKLNSKGEFQKNESGDNLSFNKVTLSETSTAPLVLSSGAPKVVYLDADTVDGKHVDDSQTGSGYIWTAEKTKEYADNIAGGLDPKESVRLATTGVLTGASYSSSGGAGGTGQFTSAPTSVDNVSIAEGDRILVKDQSNAQQNGIYIVTATTTTWDRASDMDGAPGAEVSGGNYTFVEAGDDNANSGWVLQGDGVLTLNTDDLDWVQFTGTGSFSAGNGIAINGSVVSVDPGNGIDVSGGTVTITLDGATLALGVSGIKVNDLGIDTSQLAADAVDGTKIADDSIDSEHYVDGSIDTAHLAADAVDGTKIADNAIGNEHLGDDAVGVTEINWGTGAGQVSADDLPVGSTWEGTANDVDAALEELRDGLGSGDFFKTFTVDEDGQDDIVASGSDSTMNFTSSDDSLSITSNSGTNTINIDVAATAAGAGIDLTSGVLSLDLKANSGLEIVSEELAIELKTDGGILVDENGLYLELNSDNLEVDASNGLQLKTDGIDATHIDWGSTGDQINASDVPVDSAGTYGGVASNVQDALEETLYVNNTSGDYEAAADLDMNGNDIVGIGNSSLAFQDGSKIIAANFDTDGNIILEDEVDDTTLEWVAGVDDFVTFDVGTAGNQITTTVYANDGSDPLHTWRAYPGKKGAEPALKYQTTYRHGASGNGAGVIDLAGSDSGTRYLVTRIPDKTSGTYTFSGSIFMKSGGKSDSTIIDFGFDSKDDAHYGWMSPFIDIQINQGTLYVYEYNNKTPLSTVASAVTLDGSEHTFSITIDLTSKTVSVDIGGVTKVNAVSYSTVNQTLGSLTIAAMVSSKGTEASIAIDDLAFTGYTPSSAGYVQIKDGSINSGRVAADAIDATHINWGSTGDQVDSSYLPIGSGTTIGSVSGISGGGGDVQSYLEALDLEDYAKFTSGEAMSKGSVVALNSSGKVVRAKANTANDYQAIGILKAAVGAADVDAYVQVDRIFVFSSNTLSGIGSPGDPIYLNDGTFGGYTATEPTAVNTVVKKIGIKISDTALAIAWGPTVLN